eukprot:CAMPEP_0172507086 /NCGR_PEP_ID=MMETSP1066-20121228/201159_1 /TAXON_ID=671091 /ORGANISM="Coscinodiscus wailesii, Strain CCMP2513" /LENGTH=252 /DNA_ID=CAMNT_0013284473 /DNA_START=155 /DNA_END=909 /DNA_ORIENTATION=-
MTTLTARWNLKCNSSPRSLCTFPAPSPTSIRASVGGGPSSSNNNNNPFDVALPPSSSSAARHSVGRPGGGAVPSSSSSRTNPFDTAAAEAEDYRHPTPRVGGIISSGKHSIVFGTERGALHFRTYSDEPSGSSTIPIEPIQSRKNQSPINLENAVPGAVVSITLADTSSSTIPPLFLILVDDNRGPSPSAPGTYASHVISLSHATFSKLPYLPPAALPRMSCAAYHPRTGFVYAAGGTVSSLANASVRASTV